VFLINSRHNSYITDFISSDSSTASDRTVLLNEYGIDENAYSSTRDEIKQGETFSGILQRVGINTLNSSEIAQAANDIFDIRKIAAGRPITSYVSIDSLNKVDYLVYEPNALEYVVFDFKNGLKVSKHERQVTIHTKRVAGSIQNSLYGTLTQLDLNASFGEKLADLFAHKIDFYRVQKGDSFKVVFEEKYTGDTFVGYGNIKAAVFYHGSEGPFYAFAFNQDGKIEYYDHEAKSLTNAFLKAPLKFTRISSSYTNKRFHPVLKRYKAHLGTDYAAPTGTPIYAIADGVITQSGYTSGNGNYVRLRHNKTYESGYLHMSKIASNMRPGTRVSKGQVIGYVGSTGLATGPHLCFRFWKNGQQIDFLREKLPSSESINPKYLAEYIIIRDMWKSMIDNMPIQLDGRNTSEEILASI
jgi:murein DD-endopeptidase MepM/ murein hydrolase activator NlpD